ncbi:Gfo/Idh/MocA family protein [Blastococcus atacamensis]|uniref:Gfo/Idh/MocA family protein n=1 Tax=Blastococcus atacamensis TaxID=2070508 RepID=UPI000CEBE57A|nr:Gfo/Idh/MocA family oxidoreductase [Blastococcus atacamensis]
MAQPVRLAVAGVGLIGARHVERIAAGSDTRLAGIVDPVPAAQRVADRYGVPRYETLAELFDRGRPDGVVLATPNQAHVVGGLECLAAGVPVLVEKPLADTVEGAERLVAAADEAGVPLLTGHHRTYSGIMAAARRVVADGLLGRLVAVAGTTLFRKPADYFDAGDGWRRRPGGGPVLLNLVHDVNNLQSLAGEVVRVQATTSNAARGFPVEDTAAAVLTFAGGALGTLLLSDAAASVRSWEQTAGEDPSYPTHPDEDCYHLAGTAGSLSVPTMRLTTFEGEPSWWAPFVASVVDVERPDPLANQVSHFAQVIRGRAAPLCSGRAGLRSLRVVDAVRESARTGSPVDIPPDLEQETSS